MRPLLPLRDAALLGLAGWCLIGLARVSALSEPDYELGLGTVLRESETSPDLVSRPYRAQRLRDCSAADLAEWMGSGRDFREYSREQALRKLPPPIDLWSGSVESVARQLLQRECIGRPGPTPVVRLPAGYELPASGWVQLDNLRSDCAATRRITWILRWSPQRAWLVYAGTPDWSDSLSRPRKREFDLAFWEVPPEDAHRLAAIVTLIGKARFAADRKAKPREKGWSFWGSLASEHYEVRSERGRELERLGGEVNFSKLKEPWTDAWTPPLAANLAFRAITLHGVRRLIDRERVRRELAGATPPSDEATLRAAVERVFEVAEQDPKVPLTAALAQAVGYVGEYREANALVPAVERVSARLPAPSRWELQRAHLVAEMERTLASMPTAQQAAVRGMSSFDLRYQSVGERRERKLKRYAQQWRALKTLDRDEVFDAAGFYNFGGEPGLAMRQLRLALALAQRQLREGDDVGKLQRWVESRTPGTSWAMARLRELDPAAARALLAAALVDAQAFSSGYERAEAFKLLRADDPARAEALVPKLSKDVQERIGRAPDQPEDPLVAALQAERAALGTAASGPDPARQAQRDGLFDQVWARLPKPRTSDDAPGVPNALLDDLAPLIEGVSADRQEQWRSLIATALEDAREWRTQWVQLAWIAGLRSLQPALATAGTSSASDFEGTEHGGSLRPKFTHRLHSARKVVSLWDESDAAARTKLLIAFALANGARQSAESPWRWRLERELRSAAAAIPAPERPSLIADVAALAQANVEAPSELVALALKTVGGW